MCYDINTGLRKARNLKKQLSAKLKSSRGVSLVEVMVSTVILSVGIVVIYEVFLLSLDTLNFFNNRLNAQWFLDEKIWQVQNALDKPAGVFVPMSREGTVSLGGKRFDWKADMILLDAQQELYRLEARAAWREGEKEKNIKRTTFVKRYFSNGIP